MEYISHFRKNTTLILLGAGDSSRFCSQSNLPKKQWIRIEEKPLWLWVLQRFHSFGFENILLTAHQRECHYMKNFTDFPIIAGGRSRTHSILNALQEVQNPYVLISDIARYNPQKEVIESIFETLYNDDTLACVAPYLPAIDTTLCSTNGYLDRKGLKQIQTPQLSKTQILKTALQKGDFDDESSAIASLGEKVAYTLGSPLSHKLTYAYELCSLPLPRPCDLNFVGQGIDIHAFIADKPMVLGGVQIPCGFGFKAHSDGDVLLHSIIDAIVGAIGAGDIGEWFPDSKAEFENADSKLLLEEVLDFSRSVGYEIINLDLTIIAQTPKISPHKDAIKSSLSALLSLPKYAINIKATTGEEMGFIGREEGVCVMSCVNMKFMDWSKQ